MLKKGKWDRRVCLFARVPALGVKSRLAKDIGAKAALDAHRILVEHVLTLLKACQNEIHAHVELWLTEQWQGENSAAVSAIVDDWSNNFAFPLHWQTGYELGDRMFHALDSGTNRVPTLILGADCPAITQQHLENAFQALKKSDWVFIPAEDGGYALVGCRQSDARLFSGIEWGTPSVMVQTLRRANALNYQVELLETTWDVDDLKNWRRFCDARVSSLKSP